MSKFKYEKAHAKARALNRYNLKFSNKDLINLVNSIKNGETLFSGNVTNNVSYHVIKYDNKTIVVLLDEKRNVIKTVLKLWHKVTLKDGKVISGKEFK
jgi:hypothetical protein